MKSGFCAILGKANVGKSTLLNRFLAKKLCAVSDKPQTTRHRILGILTDENAQIVFVDTPGVMKPSYELQKVMIKVAFSSLAGTDVAIVMAEPHTVEEELIHKVKDVPVIVTINKIDLLKKREPLYNLIDRYREMPDIRVVCPISALTGEGINTLLDEVKSLLPEGEPFYPEDIVSDRDERFFCSEIIREKLFRLYGEEIPYTAAVVIDEFIEREKGKTYIKAIIYVDKESVKGIIIGRGGKKLKKMGGLARREIEYFIAKPIYLDLWVKVRKEWRRNIHDIREFGYTS
ncbi:GTPase Era [candidate division WOR-3 bacterium JGI_Cruoil_03_44_89]|uniref:GTPase Era n=1 Tax=candidate division WOR-3 bacterium JGI_Cruoil_03_44_89 TaxID=1973748 RepID=A0A235BY18_UNCW3|nr:MAG: GTPase Era [candidate division WOR-3 bacterium JGI_Cruoil_03_44_89]OYD16815.1 MAG: GTPase Era [candidate division WOR-3 bacterium JGI_Cruoil_03_44_89]